MSELPVQPTRRSILVGSLAAIGGIVVSDPVGAAEPSKKSALRFVHMTDMHVKPERGSPAGYAKALASLIDLKPWPEFVITGGDHIMDALDQTRQRGTSGSHGGGGAATFFETLWCLVCIRARHGPGSVRGNRC